MSGSPGLWHTSFATETDKTHRVAADADNVYYIDETNLYRWSRAGGPVETLGSIAPASGRIVDLHVDGPFLYFADFDGVYRMPVGGGTTEVLSDGWDLVVALALDDTHVYFTDYGGGFVLKRPK